MRFDMENRVIRMMASEFVSLARRGSSDSVPLEEDEPTLSGADAFLRRKYLDTPQPPTHIYLSETLLTHNIEIMAKADKIEGDTLTFLCVTDTSVTHPRREFVAQVRGEGYLAAYGFLRSSMGELATLRFVYVNPERDEMHTVEEVLTLKKLILFFNKCKKSVAIYARPAIHRATVRIPSMKNAKFPFPNLRVGQDDFIHAVYHTIKVGTTLYSEAPTGIGKTVSALYPAIRALGSGYGEKIFYLTPKTTTATVARDTVEALSKTGVIVRAVALMAKDKICPERNVCRVDKKACRLLRNNRLSEAALALFEAEIPCVTSEDVLRVASEFSVCPYELSLTYSELCDIVICDFNYLFDRRAYLRRYFDFSGEYIFLVDEAHNLPDRAREMYSAELTEDAFAFSGYPLSEHSILRKTCEEVVSPMLQSLFLYLKNEIRTDKNGTKSGATHMRQVPDGLAFAVSRLVDACEKEIMANYRYTGQDAVARQNALYTYYYKLKSFLECALRFDEHYETFLFFEEEKMRVKLFCIDPSSELAERTSRGRATIFFSATMSPLSYTRSLLGNAREGETLTLDSPFERDQLAVAIVDRVSTRTSERERTLPAVLRVIAATVNAKRGNYMVFAPSYEYTKMLSDAFRAKYPRIRTLTQERGMSEEEKQAFMDAFTKEDANYLVAFCVTGGVFSEGIDLWGNRLIGAVVVGITLPSLSFEREAMSAYFENKYESGKEYAYVYPGFNKVLQAGGRVIRREDDRGVIVLVDDRFADPIYKKGIPSLWRGVKYIGDAKELREMLDRFWRNGEEITPC